MSASEALVVALRIMGFWLFSTVVAGIGRLASMLVGLQETLGAKPDDLMPGQAWYLLTNTLLPPLLQGIAAIVLIFGARCIAEYFYPEAAKGETQQTKTNITPKEAYRIAIQILGICVLLMAIKPGAAGIATLCTNHPDPYRIASNGIETLLLVVAGAALLRFNR